MKNEQLDMVAKFATRIAGEGAAMYFKQKGTRPSSMDDLAEALRACAKAAFPDAIRDAKSAVDCGMHHVALTTFRASMLLSGIEAAKKCSVKEVRGE